MRGPFGSSTSFLYQPDKGLVDKRRGLQCVADAFVRHVAACEAAQLVMDERHQPFQRGLLPPRQSISSLVISAGPSSM